MGSSGTCSRVLRWPGTRIAPVVLLLGIARSAIGQLRGLLRPNCGRRPAHREFRKMGGHTLRLDVRGSVSSVTRGYPYCREYLIRQHDTSGAHLATTLTSGFSGGWSARSLSTCSRTPTRTRPRRSLPGLAEAGVRALSVPDCECCAVLLRGRPPVGWDSFVFSPGIHGQQGGRLRGLPVPHRERHLLGDAMTPPRISRPAHG